MFDFRAMLSLCVFGMVFGLTGLAYGQPDVLARLGRPLTPTFTRESPNLSALNFTFTLTETDFISNDTLRQTLFTETLTADQSRVVFEADASDGEAFEVARGFLTDEIDTGLFFFSFAVPDAAGVEGLVAGEGNLRFESGLNNLREALIRSIQIDFSDVAFSPAVLPSGGVGTDVSFTVDVKILGQVPEPTMTPLLIMATLVSIRRSPRVRNASRGSFRAGR